MTRTVSTFTGDVEGSALGVTLMHEHIFVRHQELDLNFPHPEWDESVVRATAVDGLHALAELGVQTVVDLTVLGLGRDVRRVLTVADRVPVNIVAATGYYTADALPHYFSSHGPGGQVTSEDPLEQMFVQDITTGIAGTGVRAAVLKVVTDTKGFTPDVTRVWTAAAAAHRTTGAPIMTHSHAPSRGGISQLDFLETNGVDPARVVVGHAGDSDDARYLRELLSRGAFVGFDRFGMEHVASDSTRIRMLFDLLEDGHAHQIILSHDAAFFSRVTPPSWRRQRVPNWRMSHLFETVLPTLRERGVTEQMIRTMLVDNPRQILAGD